MLDPDDSRLIDAFVTAVKDMSPEKAATLLPDVSGATIRRYMDGYRPTRMTTDVRMALRKFLKDRASDGQDRREGGGNDRREGLTGREESWRVGVIAATQRAKALADLAAAELVHAEASRARGRAEEIRAEALLAHSRVAESDSGPASLAGPLLYEVLDLIGPQAEAILAAIRDREEARRIARGEPAPPPDDGMGSSEEAS